LETVSSGDRQVTSQPAPADTRLDELVRKLEREAGSAAGREAFLRIATPVAVVILAIFAWDLGVDILGLPAYMVPKPASVAEAMVEEFPALMAGSLDTGAAVVLSFLATVVVGLAFALLTYHSKLFARGFYPLLVALQAVPKVAVGPLFALWFGFGILTKAGMGFLIAVFPVIISMLVGLHSLPNEKVLLAKSIGLDSRQMFFKIRLPQALPSIFGGLKVSIALSTVGVVVGEFVGGSAGLGYLILVANHNLNSALLFAALSLMAIYSVLIFLVLEFVERIVIPWK
jgi:NitT/TauT family transport system permease protein